VSVCGTSGGGLSGNGWVGEANSPVASLFRTGRSSTPKNSGCPIEHEQVAGLVAGYHHRNFGVMTAQIRKNRLRSGVIVPHVVMNQLEAPNQFTRF
jgi:hypothetical protein